MQATRTGIDLAKNFFHLVAMDDRGKVLWRKALTRRRVLNFLARLAAGRDRHGGLRHRPLLGA